jgi:hypothetical protein
MQGVFSFRTGGVSRGREWGEGRTVFREGEEVVCLAFELVVEVGEVLQPQGEEVEHPSHGAREGGGDFCTVRGDTEMALGHTRLERLNGARIYHALHVDADDAQVEHDPRQPRVRRHEPLLA